MKKLITFVAMLLVAFSLFASFSYSIDALSFHPIHDVYIADKTSPSLQMNYIDIYKGFPDHIYQDTRNPMYFPFNGKLAGAPFVLQFKAGENISFLRNTFRFDHPVFTHVTFDPFVVQGIINEVLEGEISDMIGYEGVYWYGSALNIADIVSMRFGVHHYCSHYGDSTYKHLYDKNAIDHNYKYIRMDALAFGFSVTPYKGIRLYTEVNWVPQEFGILNFRPDIFAKKGTQHWKGIAPEGYNNLIVNAGIELSYPIFKKLGNTTIAYDCHMYEEGKIIYKNPGKTGADQYRKMPGEAQKGWSKDQLDKGGFIYYDENAPWLFEHGIVLQQELTSYLAVEIGWHMGRIPLSYMYWCDDTQWAYVGFRFDCDATVNIWDSAK